MNKDDDSKYDFEKKEIEAIKFMFDEVDLLLSHESKYRGRFDLIQERFYSCGVISEKHKAMLIRIYEIVTNGDEYDH